MNTAETILNQLGGNRFVTMTGARHLAGDDKMLQFGLPRGAKDGINKVRVTLTPADVYTVEFYKIRRTQVYAVAAREMVYADQLAAVFEAVTGLRVSL